MSSTRHMPSFDAISMLDQVVLATCQAIDTPRALTVWLLFSNNEHNQLLQLEIDPSLYHSTDDFRNDYLVTKILSKYPSLNTGIDTKQVAYETFLSCEKKCSQTNVRLSRDPFGAYHAIIVRARKIIERCLPVLDGSLKPYLPEVLDGCGWGPGVTSSVKGQRTSRFHKLMGALELTKNFSDVGGLHLVNLSSAWKQFHSTPLQDDSQSSLGVTYRLTGGNTLTFVPKNAKTDRPIAVEPHLNAFLQKGIGKFIRNQLLRNFKLDLRDQSKNCDLARQGSITGNLATLDLKSASDTISQSVVELLLPPEWVHLLGCCRSQKYSFKGKWTPYHKWSSMGNGYTFELETLLFYSLAKACAESVGAGDQPLRCYGDDLIIPTSAVEITIEVLQHFGFTVNTEKSFSHGPFRESCGKDYFNGVDTRPFFIREELKDVKSIFKLANAIQRYASSSMPFGRDARFKRIWMLLFLKVPKTLRFRIPDGVGDGGFIGSFDECIPTLSRRRCKLYQRSWYRYPCLVFKPSEGLKDGDLAITSVLTSSDVDPETLLMKDSGPKPLEVPASEVDGSLYQLRSAGRWQLSVGFTPTWTDFGPWI